jgi:hypothetical protein
MSYWLVWPVGIFIWMAVGLALFAVFEAKALKHGARANQITLSMFVYTVGSKFPLSILIGGLMVGLSIGILSTHFFWHWCPPGSVSSGMLEFPMTTTNDLVLRTQVPLIACNDVTCPTFVEIRK